jgi:hypothetical protein
MPTIVTHAFVATLLGKSIAVGRMPARFWILSAVFSVLPDIDVLGFPLVSGMRTCWDIAVFHIRSSLLWQAAIFFSFLAQPTFLIACSALWLSLWRTTVHRNFPSSLWRCWLS